MRLRPTPVPGSILPHLSAVDQIRPVRMVVDSLSELRLLARDPLRYRRQVLALRQFFAGRGSTVLCSTIGRSATATFSSRASPTACCAWSCCRASTDRAAALSGDEATWRLLPRRLPRPDAAHGRPRRLSPAGGGRERESPARTPVTSGLVELDDLLGGGLDRGTSTLLMGRPVQVSRRWRRSMRARRPTGANGSGSRSSTRASRPTWLAPRSCRTKGTWWSTPATARRR